jgi:hypothetical protein
MRYRPWVVLSAAVFGWVCMVALSPGLTVEEPIRKGLEVHEWGVFCVHDDIELANADMRAEWAALPKFVFGQTVGRGLPTNQARYKLVKKPVIFFHTDQPMALEVRVDFSGGMPAVWWPRTIYPSQQLDGCPGEAKKNEPFRHLEWHVHLKEPPKGQKSNAQPLAVDKGHWIEALRAVKADDVFTQPGGSGDIEILGRRGGELVVEPFEREHFIYYDGLVPIGKRVAVTVEKDKVLVASRVKHPILDVTVVDRRTPGHIRVARLAKLEAGAKATELDFAEVDPKEWPEAGLVILTKQLADSGLFEDEARSLAEVWKKDFFQADGLTLFFRLPQEEYEKLLPMKLKPRPEKLVRVGLVLHPHCEPDFAERVANLAGELGSNDFEARERAQKRLEEMGRAAFVHLKRLRETIKSPEAQRRLDELLAGFDALKAIDR